MESIKTLVLVLTPMFVGFAVRLPKPYLKMLDRMLVWLVYAILLLIGIGVAQVGGLWSLLNDIALRVALLFTLLTGCNLAMLCAFDGVFPWQPRRQAAHGARFCGNGRADAADFCGGDAVARRRHCAAPSAAQSARLANGAGVYALLRGFRLPICLDAA